MNGNRALLIVLICVASLQLVACRPAPAAAPEENKPARVERIDGSELSRVTLSEDARRRLDIQVDSVRESTVDGTQRKVVAYGAIIYDTRGNAWLYTEAQPRTFVRQPITVDQVKGNLAILSQGPPSGTPVVTTGVQELYGSESGIK